MTEKFNVEKVAELARLNLNKEDEAYFKDKFNSILDYVGTISKVEIKSSMKEKDESNQIIYRPDIRKDSSVSPEQFSENIENNFFKVPKIIE